MKKLLIIGIIAIIFLLTPLIPHPGRSMVFAQQGQTGSGQQETDYVDRDFPDAMDAAKDESKRDMNAVGHVASVNTTDYADLVRRTFGPVCGITTNKCDDLSYMDRMYKESLVYYSDTALAYLYNNPPASTYAFAVDMGQTLGFIPKSAYAQGIGFSGLSPLLPLWKAFRNVAYILLALFMIVVGFLIMFRKKIDPKTVITVQNALPNIVVTLILITFSYAIAGILIDMMYLLIMIAVSILKPISQGVITDQTANQFTNGTFWRVVGTMGLGVLQFFNGLIPFFGQYQTLTNTPTAVAGTIGILSFLFTGNPGSAAAAVLPGAFLVAIIGLAAIVALVRLFFVLISAYIQIIMAVIISPFQILMGALPGSHAFENWIKNLIANIAVFPITAIMILIGSIIIKYSQQQGATPLWGPPFLNPGGNNYMSGIIGLGVLFAAPSVATSVKEALKAKPLVQAGPSAIIGPLGAGASQAMNYLYQISMVSHYLPGKKDKPAGTH